MRKVITITLIVLLGNSAYAQTGTGTGSTTTGSTGTTGISTTPFGQAFNFSSGFTSTGITSPFANTTTGRIGTTGMGGMGMGGMGFGMGGMGMMGMGGMGMGMGGMGMGGMGMNRNQQGMRGNTMQQQYTLRPTVKLGFETTMPSTQARTQQIRATMTRLPQAERFAGANITVDGRKAIVTGTVDKSNVEVLKRLLQLEPGIYEVDMSQINGGSGTSRNRSNSEQVAPGTAVPPPSN